MTSMTTNIDTMGNLLTRAIRDEMYAMVKAKLEREMDDILSEFARELTDKIVANVHTYSSPNGFGPQTTVSLSFNATDTKYKATRD